MPREMPTPCFGYDILHFVVLKESLCELAAWLFHIDFKSPPDITDAQKNLMDRFCFRDRSNTTAVLELLISWCKGDKKMYVIVFQKQINLSCDRLITKVRLERVSVGMFCKQKRAEGGTLTTSGWKGRAALRGHPQICWTRVKHHIEHLGRRADADFPKILSLSRRSQRKSISNMKHSLLLCPLKEREPDPHLSSWSEVWGQSCWMRLPSSPVPSQSTPALRKRPFPPGIL